MRHRKITVVVLDGMAKIDKFDSNLTRCNKALVGGTCAKGDICALK